MDPYPYDPQKARELLEEAGYDFDRTIIANTPVGRYYFDKEIAEACQAMFAEIGMKVELTAFTDFAQYLDVPKHLDQYDMTYTSWYPIVTDADGALYLRYYTDAVFNYGKYSNARVDELLDAARSTLDESFRLEAYREIQEILWEDAAQGALYFQTVIAGADAHVKGVRYYPIERLSVKWAYWEE
jgi:peptide/nickel transport system substrate-binding protein